MSAMTTTMTMTATEPSTKLPEDLHQLIREPPQRIKFDPAKHLCFQPPLKVYSMAEIGKEDEGVSSFAVSEPFPLFNTAAIEQMRAELLSRPVLEKCRYSSNIAGCQLRGMVPKYAPFVYDVWHNPEVLSIISKIAGIELTPVIDFEIAHVNIALRSEEEQKKQKQILAKRGGRTVSGATNNTVEDDTPAVAWHKDSYPFVCVLMLSDCSEMVGGETALRTGHGEIMKVRGPERGNAVVMQGRYIEHQALKALGGKERITLVTSFRPKDPLLEDDTVLKMVRPISNLPELYGQYAEYRVEMLEDRFRDQLKKLREQGRNGDFDTPEFKDFLHQQKDFIQSMLVEIVDDDKVIPGVVT